MSDPDTLPLDFVEYLCAERRIERHAALELLAAEVRTLSQPERAEQAAPTDEQPSASTIQGIDVGDEPFRDDA
jgi:hypothetical protein